MICRIYTIPYLIDSSCKVFIAPTKVVRSQQMFLKMLWQFLSRGGRCIVLLKSFTWDRSIMFQLKLKPYSHLSCNQIESNIKKNSAKLQKVDHSLRTLNWTYHGITLIEMWPTRQRHQHKLLWPDIFTE